MNYKNNYPVFILNLIICLFIFRTAIPFFKYPFILIYSGFIFYSLIIYRNRIKRVFKEFILSYKIVLIVFIYLILSIVFTNKIFLATFKDILNILIILSFFYCFHLLIVSKEKLSLFISNLIKQIIFFAVIIALIGLFGGEYSYIFNTTIPAKYDYNFALIPLLFGIVIFLYKLTSVNRISIKIFYNLLLLFFTVNILLSQSRRALIVLLLIIVALFGIQLLVLFKRSSFLKRLSRVSIVYLSSLILTLLVSYLLIFKASNNLQNRILKTVGVENVYEAKHKITKKLYRYNLIVNSSLSYNNLFYKLWPQDFALDSESGWGKDKRRIVYPLQGDNVEIVPFGAKAYVLDSKSSFEVNEETAYFNIFSFDFKKNRRIRVVIYCYVSENFDGAFVGLCVNKNIESNNIVYYDLKHKGKWQRLNLETDYIIGHTQIDICFTKEREGGFKSLNGNITIAYPFYEVIGNERFFSKNNDIPSSLNYRNYHNIKLKKNDIKTDHYKLYPYKEDNEIRLYQSSLSYNMLMSKALGLMGVVKDSDPFREWVKKLINEDTTYYKPNRDLGIKLPKSSLQKRTFRWKFALRIFKNEYDWKRKIFGGGFNYLNWYGYYFLNDKTKSDWPHNPFLSVLLYSGIVGLLLYFLLLYKVFYYYLKYIRKYYILFLFFLITFFFSFFSANNPFDPPVMGFFVMLPFLIHAVHKKDNSSESLQNDSIKE